MSTERTLLPKSAIPTVLYVDPADVDEDAIGAPGFSNIPVMYGEPDCRRTEALVRRSDVEAALTYISRRVREVFEEHAALSEKGDAR
ncbi:hypothetical protein [Acidomonas methanolica]|uniref:Uncharacterized protein n=1 Tax=Acidomonas methanolica NBRC 104435 TaxID=1231351 RepID=A0A023D6X3_ACIMT|nr:hypothetical protein [Acidomonas methanolica]TCS23822.1 hypothetical protein EDC31_12740 [Acidomonas methanolica]GAJ29834.1 hypothetical protein Amme_083_009 [Acidomonas methanolica NBRC 104435]GBQ52907.1 hypothetical protein AA0498_1830 [Acidomonas methanolica]GEL00183.1 hypothetical protein AME01nite_26810 [Acidomonas methanolica NBRC 104435]